MKYKFACYGLHIHTPIGQVNITMCDKNKSITLWLIVNSVMVLLNRPLYDFVWKLQTELIFQAMFETISLKSIWLVNGYADEIWNNRWNTSNSINNCVLIVRTSFNTDIVCYFSLSFVLQNLIRRSKIVSVFMNIERYENTFY